MSRVHSVTDLPVPSGTLSNPRIFLTGSAVAVSRRSLGCMTTPALLPALTILRGLYDSLRVTSSAWGIPRNSPNQAGSIYQCRALRVHVRSLGPAAAWRRGCTKNVSTSGSTVLHGDDARVHEREIHCRESRIRRLYFARLAHYQRRALIGQRGRGFSRVTTSALWLLRLPGLYATDPGAGSDGPGRVDLRSGPMKKFVGMGLYQLRRHREIPDASHTSKIIVKPCAGKPHARFERGCLETGQLRLSTALTSTNAL